MKHYIIYQIRNKLNGMIYIGKHQTDNINDNYMGSGLRIKRAIEKYGTDNFEKTILFECSSEEEMNKKEAEIVNEDFIARDDVYNISLGGYGGLFKTISFESKSKASKKRWQNMSQEQRLHSIKNILETNKNNNALSFRGKKISQSLKNYYSKNPPILGMLGKHHSDTSRKKMVSSHIGEKNSQYGTIWIYNPETMENKKIKNTDCIPDGWIKGRKIK